MKTTTLLLTPLLLAIPALAQNCAGDFFNNYCCVNGEFSGPVISSFSASFSSRDSSLSGSQSSRQASLTSSLSAAASSRSESQASVRASISSDFQSSGAAAMITERAVVKGRAITTEVSSGLTCVGDAVSTESGDGSGVTVVSSGGSSSTVTTSSSSSTSTGGAAMMTQAPMLAMGAAAAAFAYGAM